MPPRPLAGARIALATLKGPLVKLSGASHVRLVGLAVEHGHGDGIVVAGGEGVEIAGCTVAACAGTGIAVTGSKHVVRSCDLHHLGGAGIRLDGGDRVTLTAGGCAAINNRVHHYAFFRRTYAGGVGVQGCGHIVRHNFIHDLGGEASREGFTIGLHVDARGMKWPQWNNPKLDQSWALEEKAKQLNYTSPPWSTRYPRLAAIMDEAPREPRGNPIRCNVFVDCTRQVCDFDGDVRKLLDTFEVADNLSVDTGPGGPRPRADVRGFTDLAGTAAEPVELGFVDAAAGDFTLRPDAGLRREAPAFVPIRMYEIGLQPDEYRPQVPAR